MNLIYLGAVMWVIGLLIIKALESYDPFGFPMDYNKRKPPVVRNKRMKKDLMSWQLYRSDRFIVHGNIGWRIIIKDYRENLSYDIEYGDLVKFRSHWDHLKDNQRETYLAVVITSQKGRPMNNQKVA